VPQAGWRCQPGIAQTLNLNAFAQLPVNFYIG
jgi:hypothetical protein